MRVSDKKDRGIIADKVPVSLFRIEFAGKAADITFRISSPAFSCDGGKTHKDFCLFTDFFKNFSTRIFGNISGYSEFAESTAALGMHPAFRDNFPLKMGKLLHQPDILHKDGTALAGCHAVFIAWHRGSYLVSQLFALILFHRVFLHSVS